MKFKIGDKVNSPRGPGTIYDYSEQKVRVGGWDGHDERKITYHVILDGDTHHRPYEENEIFPINIKPPDPKQCQAEKPNGCTFLTLGGKPELVRCTNAPVAIATEKHPGDDGHIGSMSLCADCREVFIKQMGDDYATFEEIQKC